MDKFNYSEQLPDEMFNEMKELAISVWQTYDDTYGYATEKIETFSNWENIRDNIRSIYGMFDWQNQYTLYQKASDKLKAKIDELNAWNRFYY